MMARAFRACFAVVFCCATLWHLAGCKSPQQTADTIAFLRDGHAEGHLVVTTDGAVSAGATQDFYLGAKGTRVSFDGSIDFRGDDAARAPVSAEAVADRPPG